MSQIIRPVWPSGSTRNVAGAGIATMSDSSIALKPVIDEPSKPMPSSSAPSSSLVVIAKLFRWPSRSVNQSSTSSMPRSSTSFSTLLRASGSDVALFLLSICAMAPPRSTRRSLRSRRRYARSMAERFLGGLARVVGRRRRAVFAVWLALLAAGGWFSLHQNDHLSGGGWEVPGSPSLRVTDVVNADFPSIIPPVFVVFVTGDTRSAVRDRLAAARRRVAADRHLKPGRAVLLDGGRAALLPLAYVGKTSNAIDQATRLRPAL